MSYFQWKPEMSVGLTRLDDDHKSLIAIINRLAGSLGPDDGNSGVQQALTALLRYTEHHFGREEAVLRAVNYTALTQHRDEHKRFIRDLQELRADFATMEDTEQKQKLLDFLKDWLTHHILIEDMAYKDRVSGDKTAAKAAEKFSGADIWTTRLAG
ncbi:MAG: bacteriohemerythrin [Alphaproteobacteria bacterium]|nr:bacteriohemerythrin [Alphaproteobacteria bacterium]